jgi:phenylpyruvate tautomerase PptA (4-oxalocrotonate tautomerase family)
MPWVWIDLSLRRLLKQKQKTAEAGTEALAIRRGYTPSSVRIVLNTVSHRKIENRRMGGGFDQGISRKAELKTNHKFRIPCSIHEVCRFVKTIMHKK